MTVATHTKIESKSSSDWILQPQKGYFTHDELIDAYLKGKEEQKNENQRILMKELQANIELAKSIVEQISEEIVKKGFDTVKSYLRINNISKYDAIFDVPVDHFTSEQFDEVYKLSSAKRRESNSDTFSINLTFMPHTESLNEKRIVCEGFIYSYEKR